MLANKLMSAALSGGAEDKLYVDDVFSAFTYTGNGATQTINNGIDLAGKGGMVWMKGRSAVAQHRIIDSSRSKQYTLATDTTDAQLNQGANVLSFLANGFSLDQGNVYTNAASTNYVSWTFRKAPKFFDVVTYTGNGVAGRWIPHALNCQPGMVMVKCTSASGDWWVFTRRGGAYDNYEILKLNTTGESLGSSGSSIGWPGIATFSVDWLGSANTNVSGATYVAYLFAHDPSADGIIQCGSFTTDGSSNATVNLGWEPQYLMVKTSASADSGWEIYDTSRGWNRTGTGGSQQLKANASTAESSATSQNDRFYPITTGFQTGAAMFSSSTYIYLAIRRPNKPPTTGTEVYNAIARTGTGVAATVTGVGFAPDLAMIADRAQGSGNGEKSFIDRLRGSRQQLVSNTAAPEAAFGADGYVMGMGGVTLPVGYGAVNGSGGTYINHFFRRAPGFFDVVCYTGTGVARTVPHSLGVAPELMIVKSRSSASLGWAVYPNDPAKYVVLNSPAGLYNDNTGVVWNSLAPTATHFSVGSGETIVNLTGATFVAYLFASLPGISKVGSYTGNGTSQTIACGFTTGARFVMIKRTDSGGNWYVFDSVRGIVAGNDPYLQLNTSQAENAYGESDGVDPAVSGFIVNQNVININVSGGQYIFLAIA